MSAGMPEVRWVTFTVAESGDMFALPSIGLKMPVVVALDGGRWTAMYGTDGDHSWAAHGDTQDEAIVRLLAARIGVVLP